MSTTDRVLMGAVTLAGFATLLLLILKLTLLPLMSWLVLFVPTLILLGLIGALIFALSVAVIFGGIV